MSDEETLSPEELARYEWQIWTPDVGIAGQQRLKQATVLISRIGGLGGTVAYYLAAAGVGRLILAHGGNVKPSDLNRQLLMTTDWLGKPRVESAVRRLRELNPHVELVPVNANIGEENVVDLVAQADLIVDAAPRFEERLLLNRESVRQRRPMVEAAMHDFAAQLTLFQPGQTGCLACMFPDGLPDWKREFPVFGAVSGTVASLAAVEAIKLLTGLAPTLAGRLLYCDLRQMEFVSSELTRNPQCAVCGS